MFFVLVGMLIFDLSPPLRKLFFDRYGNGFDEQIFDVDITFNKCKFYEVLKWKRIDYWIREEIVSSQRLGIERLKCIAFENLVQATFEDYASGKILHSLPNYDILSNNDYARDLIYVPCIVPLRSSFSISPYSSVDMRVYSSDLVRCIIDLPYVPESVAKEFEFSVEYLAKSIKKRLSNGHKNEVSDQ